MSLADRLKRRFTRTSAATSGAATSELESPEPKVPQLSVIVPFYGVEAYLAACLDSLLAQAFTDTEILLIDDGSPDGSRVIAEEYAARDSRIRVIERPNGGLGAARNTGIREARGTWLTFVDSDDIVPPAAFETLVASARETGSDIVVGSLERFDSDETWIPAWVEQVHDRPRLGVTVTEFPAVLRNLYTWNKVYRHDFWEREGLWFREGVAYEDQPIVTQLLARAARLDVLPEVVYRWRRREDQSSISQQRGSLKDLRDRIAAWHATREVLREERPDLYQDWLATLFEAHFIWYLADPAVADDDFWAALEPAVRLLATEADETVWHATSPGQRVLVSLALQGRRRDVLAFAEAGGVIAHPWPTTARADGLLLDLPLLGDPDLPEPLFVRRPEQLTVAQSLDRLRWQPDAPAGPTLEIGGWAYLRNVDLTGVDQQVSVELVDSDGTVRASYAAAPTERIPPERPPYEDPIRDYARARFDALIPLAPVVAAERPLTVWVRVEARGLTASTPITGCDLPPRWRRETSVPGGRVEAQWRHLWPLTLQFQAAPVVAVAAPDGPTVLVDDVRRDGPAALWLSGRVAGVADGDFMVRTRHRTGGGVLVPGSISAGRFRVSVPLMGDSGRPLATGMHEVRFELADGVVQIADPDPDYTQSLSLVLPFDEDRLHDVTVTWRTKGSLRLNLQRPLGEVRTRYHQVRLASRIATEPRDGVLFLRAEGRHLTDAAEFGSRRPDVPVYAGVRDLSIAVPDGVHGLVVNSPQWHEVRGSIRWFVTDQPLTAFEHSPDWQTVIEAPAGEVGLVERLQAARPDDPDAPA